MNALYDRMIRAAKLDKSLYEEVEKDQSAMGQAMAVVILSSLAAGIGGIEKAGFVGFLGGLILALIGWFIWSYLTYAIGTKILPTPETKTDYSEMLRTIGFASSPGIIRVLGIIPGLSGLVFGVSGIWMLIAMVIAVKQALDYTSTMRAVGVCIIGWIILSITTGLFLAMFR